MSKYNDLRIQVPPFINSDPIMDDIYKVQGTELDTLKANTKDVLDQLFVDTATWGLRLWEDYLKIPYDINKSIEERRNAVKSKILGTKVFTLQQVRDIAALFGYTVSMIQENVDPYTVQVKLETTTDFQQVRSFMAAINELKPAHIDFQALYNLSTWGDIQSSNVNYLALTHYTFHDFLLSGLGDGANYHTDHLGLKQWALEDVFRYDELNYDFNAIDSLFKNTTGGHTHNGIDSCKIDSTGLKYDATKTVKQKMDEINSIAGDTASKQTMVDAIGSPATISDSYTTLAGRITTGKSAIATALTNKGQSSTSSDTFAQMAAKVIALAGTVIPAGTAQPYHVKSGKTFVNSSGKQTGTMATRSGITYTPGLNDIDISGYQDGTCVIKGAADLLPQNIRYNVTIFGVTGTVQEPDYIIGEVVSASNVEIQTDGSGNITGYKILA